MDEIIVRLTRSLACHDRLRLISCLVAEGELSPTELARKLKVSATALSGHMTKLTAMGLIKRRRSGAWSYCVAESPYGESTLSGMTLAWLRQVLASPEQALKDCGLHEVRNFSSEQAQRRIHDLIFDAATAFTDLRRLQILRFLQTSGEALAEVMVTKLKMSPWAVSRHTSKLMRRGYVCASVTREALSYRMAKSFKTKLHARLWEIIQRSWQKEGLRTS